MIRLKNKKWLQVIILCVILVIGGATIISGFKGKKDGIPKVGDVAPNFALTNLEGQVEHLSDYAGKAIMLNFWGTFCEPCITEMPLFQQYYERYGEELVVLGVNLHEPPVTVRKFVRDYELTFPILLDKTVVSKQYGVRRYPTTFFINKDGKIEQKVDMLIDEARLKPLVTQLLK